MKYTDLEKFIKKHNLLIECQEQSGIYAILLDNIPVYIGQSKNVYTRCSQHIYNVENAMFNQEKKYLLLLAAKLGGHHIDCKTMLYCSEDELREWEDKYIEEYAPCLNILTPTGKQHIEDLKIEDVLNYVKDRKDKYYGD